MTTRIVETEIRHADVEHEYRSKEQMAELCCKDTPALPCAETVEPWGGFSRQEILEKLDIELDDQGCDGNGNYVTIRFVGKPPGGICGELVTRYNLDGRPCCDDPDLAELLYDDVDSVDTLADFSQGWIAWDGGLGPFTVTVEGDGFWLNNLLSQKTFVAEARACLVFSGTACGSCVVTISDRCGDVVTGVVRSVNGSWSAYCYKIDYTQGTCRSTQGVRDFAYDPDTCTPEIVSYDTIYRPYCAILGYLRNWGSGGWLSGSTVPIGYKWADKASWDAALAQSPLPVNPGADPPDESYSCPGAAGPCEWGC